MINLIILAAVKKKAINDLQPAGSLCDSLVAGKNVFV